MYMYMEYKSCKNNILNYIQIQIYEQDLLTFNYFFESLVSNKIASLRIQKQ